NHSDCRKSRLPASRNDGFSDSQLTGCSRAVSPGRNGNLSSDQSGASQRSQLARESNEHSARNDSTCNNSVGLSIHWRADSRFDLWSTVVSVSLVRRDVAEFAKIQAPILNFCKFSYGV